MNRNVRVAGIAACLGLSLIVAGTVLGTGSSDRAALPAPIPADADPAAEGQATPVGGGTTKPPAGSISATQAIKELRGRGKNSPSLVVDSSGTIKTVTAAPGKTLGPQRDAFTSRYAAGFGASEKSKLQVAGSSVLPGGDSVTRYQQVVDGLPVMGGELLVTTNGRGGVRGAISALSGFSPKATNAKISAADARSIAVKAIGERYVVEAGQITDAAVKLWLADLSKLGQQAASLSPVYWVQLSGANGVELGDVLVDALDGSVELAASEHQTARKRRVCDLNNARVNLRILSNYLCATGSALNAQTSTRTEGKPASSVADVNAAYNHLGATYDFYKSTFGLDSFDGNGTEIRATVRACDTNYPPQYCPYANAFWEGSQFVFGEGWAVDDVVAHEYTHAVTEHASGLFYWYEPGAINEAFSDIMGQFVDLRTPADDAGANRWLLGEALNGPTQFGAIRSMSNPNSFGDPARYGDPLWQSEILGNEADNGGVHYNSGVANKLATLIADGGSFNGYTVLGLGLTRSEQLWYRVMHLVPSGADYRQLRLAMTSACQELIGSYGIRPFHCAAVQKAMNAVELPLVAAEKQVEAEYCPGSAYEAPADIFFDDFENGSSDWFLSDAAHWQLIPSAVVPYTYAASGQGSINGWTTSDPANPGTGDYMELVSPVALLAGKAAYLHFASSVIRESGAAGGVYVQANGGSWTSVQPVNVGTRGYGATRIDLSAYAGQSVKVRFKLENSAFIDWYLDDVRIYNCAGRPSAPTNPVAYYDGTSIRACWSLPKFTGTAPSSWDVQVTPNANPGALVRSAAGSREQLLIPNVDPNLTYTVVVTYVSNGQLGEPARFVIKPNPAATYLSPFTFEPRRPAPGPQHLCAGEGSTTRR